MTTRPRFLSRTLLILTLLGPTRAVAAARFSTFWPGMKRGLLEYSAQVIGIFDRWELKGIKRDGVWFTYALKFAAAQGAVDSQKLDYLSISFDSHRSEQFDAYLRQSIGDEFFRQGKGLLLLDTGYAGGILKAIRSRYPQHEDRIQALFTASNNPQVMVSRVFQVAAYGTDALKTNPADLLEDSHQIETHLPKFHGRASHYELQGSIWVPAHYAKNDTHLDGNIDPAAHVEHRKDLGAYMERNHELLESRISLWRNLKQLATSDRPGLISKLKSVLANTDDSFSEAIVRDMVDFYPSLVALEQVGLAPVPGAHQRGPVSCLSLIAAAH